MDPCIFINNGGKKMFVHSFRLMSLFSVVTALLICSSGCSPEEKNGTAVNDSTVVKDSEADFKEPAQAVDVDKIEAEKTTPSETAEESTATKTEPLDSGSADNILPNEIVLLSQLWETHTKGAVKLTHENHIKTHNITCRECHHIIEDGKNVWNESIPAAKCETCHDELTVKGERKLPPEIQKKNLKLAFHNNCRGCHKKIKKEDPETKAPLKCSECHEKKT
jgi:hypothetical protein